MTSIGICTDVSEAVELFEPQGLYMKPIAKINISVQLPQMKTPGKSISNWEVMEKLKKMIKPEQFLLLKVAKSTLEFVRFEGEIENKGKIKVLVQRLDSKTIKLSGFSEVLKVRAAEAKAAFPSRHDWESYFRDAKNMNEMKPGERPDTIHVKDLPCRWFANRKEPNRDKPSEYILRKVAETFGEVRCLDIPRLDPYRQDLKAGAAGAIQTFSFGQDLTFEAFVQYKDYVGFMKAMTALRGMKLMYKEKGDDDKALTANLKVDFDRTKHLSDKAIRRRRQEREKLIELEKEREDRVKRQRLEEEQRKEDDRRRQEEEERERERRREEKIRRREERRKSREDKRRQRHLEKRRKKEEELMSMKIAREERRILIAQRKLETIRLLSELFNRVKIIKQQEELARREAELDEERKRHIDQEKRRRLEAERQRLLAEKRKSEELERQEKALRCKILSNMKVVEERRLESQRESLRKKIAGKTRLKSAVMRNK